MLVQSWKAIIEVVLEPQADEYKEWFNKYETNDTSGHQRACLLSTVVL